MLRACIAFAWINLARGDRLRLVVALGGAVVAIFLLLLHIAFLRAIEHKVTQVYAMFDADIVMVSERFQFLDRPGDFPVARLRQALSTAGVADAAAVRFAKSRWVSSGSGARSSLLLFGIDSDPAFVADAGVRALLPELRVSRRVLLDRRSDPDVGVLSIGDTGHIRAQPALIAGLYDLGLPMYASATAIVSNSDFSLYTGRDPQRMQLGLLRLAPGTDAAHVLADLQSALPGDVRVMARNALMAQEAAFFIDVKPLGIMMRAGLLIGTLVGAVALFQIMSSQVEARMRDFAILRTMGFSASFTYAVGAWQLVIMGVAAFAAAWLAAGPAFDAIANKTHLFLPRDGALLNSALMLALPMIAAAGLPLLRAGRADPAGLFARG